MVYQNPGFALLEAAGVTNLIPNEGEQVAKKEASGDQFVFAEKV